MFGNTPILNRIADFVSRGNNSEGNAISTTGKTGVIEFTPALDTNIYASGDVLGTTTEIPLALFNENAPATLLSVEVLDKADQGEAFDIVFFRSNVSLGTDNAAVSISDTDAEEILGIVSVVADDYVDLINSQVATKVSLGLGLKGAADSKSLYAGLISRGTGTYAASSLVFKVTFYQD